MIPPWLREALEVGRLQLPRIYPRDLAFAIPLQLPLAFIPMSDLATNTLEEWLSRRQIPYGEMGTRRRLHGALVARAGRGLIFIDSSDEPVDQRFTAAHETAHFIEDHLAPRLKALKSFGEAILQVIDGERPPTPEESVSAVLSRVPLGVQVHLMARDQFGTVCSWDVEECEQRADRLALELVAPAEDVLRALRQSSSLPGAATRGEEPARILSRTFGLSMNVARSYLDLLLGERPRPKLSAVLLGGNQ